jgi:hypothetical protein
VWRNKDLSKIVMVRPDGRISLPLIGDVQASGLSPTELTADINRRLKEFVESPAVSVMVKEVNSYSIFVMGQVATPARRLPGDCHLGATHIGGDRAKSTPQASTVGRKSGGLHRLAFALTRQSRALYRSAAHPH